MDVALQYIHLGLIIIKTVGIKTLLIVYKITSQKLALKSSCVVKEEPYMKDDRFYSFFFKPFLTTLRWCFEYPVEEGSSSQQMRGSG